MLNELDTTTEAEPKGAGSDREDSTYVDLNFADFKKPKGIIHGIIRARSNA